MQHIIELHNKQKNEADLRGENYNVFNVLGLTSSETRLHSAFIANLLDPKGKHGLNIFPLRQFLKIVNFKDLELLAEKDLQNAQVIVEYHIGPISENYTQGGNIDILIKIQDYKIVIENKIYAGDQKSQILRYKNFCCDGKHQLIYLTLDGHNPSEDSSYGLEVGKDFDCISYGKEIYEWLNMCLVHAVDKPLIRETLQQYINIINRLTNKIMDKNNLNSLFETMCQNPEVIETIYGNVWAYRRYLIENYLIKPMKEWCKENGYEYYEDEEFMNDSKYHGFGIYRSEWNKMVAIEFDKSEFKLPYWGVWKWRNTNTNQLPAIGPETTENWPYGWQLSKYYAYNENVSKDFIDGRIFDEVRDNFIKIIKIIEDNSLDMK